MLKIKDDIQLKELEKFGFENNVYTRKFDSEDGIAYQVVITRHHHYLQIRNGHFGNIAGSLQDLFYDLIQAGLVDKVSD